MLSLIRLDAIYGNLSSLDVFEPQIGLFAFISIRYFKRLLMNSSRPGIRLIPRRDLTHSSVQKISPVNLF